MAADFFTATLFVDASTIVAEMHATLTSHMIASMRLLNPNFALRTLFELTTLNELQKLLVVFVCFDCAPKFSTTFPSVKWNHTAQTIMLLAGFTFELTVARLVKYKGVLAVRGRTPAHVR